MVKPSLRGGHPHDSSYLSDHTDQPWDERRSVAEDVRTIFAAHGLLEWARRIDQCAEFLHFARTDDGLELLGAHFCRVRMCPVCQWRRALRWRVKLYAALPAVEEAFPKARWVFVTLTVRNCPVQQLGQVLDEMSRAWQRLTERAEFKRPTLGWLRSVEVTKGSDNSAHPHYHCLLLVQPSYFTRYYVKRSRWAELWQEAARLDYRPVIDVRAVQPGGGIIPEVAKYSLKPGALGDDVDEWLVVAARQLHKRRLVAAGGVLRQVLREIEALEAGGPSSEQKPDLSFVWRRRERRYKRRQPRGSASSEG